MAVSRRGIIPTVVDSESVYEEGFIDIADSATSLIPLPLPAGVETLLENDGLGEYSSSEFMPESVSNVWADNQFDFSELSLGSEVFMRIDLLVTTTFANTDIDLNMLLGGGLVPFTLPVISSKSFKNSGTYQIVETIPFYIGNLNALNGFAQLLITSDKLASVLVNGFYLSIKKRL